MQRIVPVVDGAHVRDLPAVPWLLLASNRWQAEFSLDSVDGLLRFNDLRLQKLA